MNVKRANASLLAAVLALCLSGCSGIGEKAIHNQIEQELVMDLPAGTVITENDSHGGFHGDGTSYAAIQFEDDAFESMVSGAENWFAFPMDETVQALVYGCGFEDRMYGPYLTDEEGNPLIPAVVDGYYYLKDRQADGSGETAGADILHRPSLNVTVAVYDSEQRMLYYCGIDT